MIVDMRRKSVETSKAKKRWRAEKPRRPGRAELRHKRRPVVVAQFAANVCGRQRVQCLAREYARCEGMGIGDAYPLDRFSRVWHQARGTTLFRVP